MLIRRIHAIDTDYVILDLGAGTGQNILDFFLTASSGLVVTAPTPTATVNAYLFLKNAVFRLLQNSVVARSAGERYVKDLFKNRASLQRIYLPEIVRQLESADGESASRFRSAIARFRPRVVMNMLEDPKDAETINRLRRSCRQYLDIELVHLGIIYRDDLQDRALQSRLPILRYKPSSVLSQAIVRIAEKIVQFGTDEGGFFDIEAVNDSFDAAEAEAEQDFNEKMEYIEELLSTGALTHGDLIETIKSQHYEIAQLRKQNNLYKAKIVQAIQQGYRPS
jgi:flagellar biosynthesis protein FlhG